MSLPEPLTQLVRHFFSRFFDAEWTGSEDDGRLSTGAMLAVLTAPGALMTLTLFGKYSALMRWFHPNIPFDPVTASVPDKYTFLAFSFSVTLIVMALKWDGLFPDRRDWANLSPLPLSAVQIFAGKSLALAGFAALFTVALNAVPTILFPAVVMEHRGTFPELLRFMGAHAAAALACGVFAFSAVLAVIGFLLSVLPYTWFRHASRPFQFALVLGALTLFFTAPSVTPWLLEPAWVQSVRWLPPVWFLGLYQDLQGQSMESLDGLSLVAIAGMGISLTAAVLFYLVSYQRYYLRSAEQPEVSGGRRSATDLLIRALDGSLLRTPFQQVGVRFSLRTLTRSDRHCAILAGALGLGASLAVQGASSSVSSGKGVSQGELAIGLTLLFFLVTSARVAFGLPADLRAAWLFQAVPQADERAQTIARRSLWALAVPFFAGIFLLAAFRWGLVLGAIHVAYCAMLALLLIETALYGYRAMPFTVPSVPGRENFVRAIALYAGAYALFVHGGAGLERWMLGDPWRWTVLAFFGFFVVLGLRQLQEDEEPAPWGEQDGAFVRLQIIE